MITESEYQKAAGMYSDGRLDFEELLSVIHGRVSLEVLMADRGVSV